MSDNETPKGKAPRTGASGAAWTDKERLAYLVLLIEAGGKYDDAPVPAGRSIVSCRKMIVRLKSTCSEDISKIKAGIPIANDFGDEGKKTPKKPVPIKRKKTDANSDKDEGDEGKVTVKKARGRPSKKAATEAEAEAEKEEAKVKEEAMDEEMMQEFYN